MRYKFQSTHPSWGATLWLIMLSNQEVISIHAPIVGCDQKSKNQNPNAHYFNPRTHRGVRLLGDISICLCYRFQSTHPSWGATPQVKEKRRVRKFQSTHPSWGATLHLLFFFHVRLFQSTHPSWGATNTNSMIYQNKEYFNPRTHRGVRQSLSHSLHLF